MSEIIINLPTLHSGQVKAYDAMTRFFALICGRRYGKTAMMQTIACDKMIKGQNIGWFAPDYKIQSEAFREITDLIAPVKKQSSKIDGIISTSTGGRADFWTLENERAGRSRKYHAVFIDEAAFTKPNMMHVWETAIKPSLLDYQGTAMVASTPNGVNDENFFYKICNDASYGFTTFHAPTHDNPYLPIEELEKLERENHPLVYQQEYLAKFVDWSGAAFFSMEKLLENGQPVPHPDKCDGVFAVIDTAVKGGKEHDGTAVIYCAYNQFYGTPLIILDWDVVQIDGALLESWMPSVQQRTKELSENCKARNGVMGIYVEDAAAGSILLQQSNNRGWGLEKIDSGLTAKGKDERAISVSGYVHQGKVKLSDYAYDKNIGFKGIVKNHLVNQIASFRIGDKDAYKRADDLTDCFTYAIALSLGNNEGY